jgi:hypothetical protein
MMPWMDKPHRKNPEPTKQERLSLEAEEHIRETRRRIDETNRQLERSRRLLAELERSRRLLAELSPQPKK